MSSRLSTPESLGKESLLLSSKELARLPEKSAQVRRRTRKQNWRSDQVLFQRLKPVLPDAILDAPENDLEDITTMCKDSPLETRCPLPDQKGCPPRELHHEYWLEERAVREP